MKSVKTTLQEGRGAFGMVRKLIHRTAGMQCAGSGETMVAEAYGSIGICRDGTTCGQWFKTEPEAMEHYLSMVTPIVGVTA